MVTFLLGCSFSFEHALQSNGIQIKNINEQKNVAIKTITGEKRFEKTHDEPLYCGYDYTDKLGINKDLSQVDFGDSVTIDQQIETPCFWYCGVTGIMAAIEASKIAKEICITHSPGYMFVSDIKEDEENSTIK